MPGSLPNTTIKNAIDQVIAAINDISLTVDGDLVVDTDNIVAKLEEIRTLYETESLAQITAQNTNFTDLIAAMTAQTEAIAALTLQCNTIVNTTQLHQTITSGCGGGGLYPPSPPTDPSDPPPPGYNTVTRTQSDHCKIAYAMHQNIQAYVKSWDDHAVDTIATAATAGLATILGEYLFELATGIEVAVPFIEALGGGGVIAWITNQVIELMTGGYDLGRMAGILNDPDNEQDFVCAIYIPANSSSVISSYLDVAEAKGMVPGDRLLLATIMTTDLANYLWWSREQYIEDALANFNPDFDCSVCGVWWLNLVGQIQEFDEDHITIGSVQVGDSAHMVSFQVYAFGDVGEVMDLGVTLESGSITPPGNLPEYVSGWIDDTIPENMGAGATFVNWDTGPYPPWWPWIQVWDEATLGTFNGAAIIQYRSSVLFQVTFTRL